ncbi:hypothetical protein OPQ81_000795 [Rhizoctonia solani]|nr:hypothetical protein OPQ81_000795 [Rhizoctonia solani]
MEIESQGPLLQDVRDIALTTLGNYALVSYENKAPPQTWRIDEVYEHREDEPGVRKCQLTISQSESTVYFINAPAYYPYGDTAYATKSPVDFVGPSFFGGPKDTFVLAASRGGEIYIWERSSGILLHTLVTPSNQEASHASTIHLYVYTGG